MNEEQFIQLTTKYLSKGASVEEIEILFSMRKQSKYSALFARISRQWNKTAHKDSDDAFDVENGLKRLAASIRNYDPSFQWEQKAQQKHFMFFQPISSRIAASCAVLILFIASILLVSHFLILRPAATAWNEKRTMMGEKAVVTLLDGTKIMLNADSKIKYPVRFGEESREVLLQGEAYFEVTHNVEKPFKVRTGNISTTDLGTKFNIKSFPYEKSITVSLEDGIVEVSTNQSSKEINGIILAPAQQIVYNKENETSTVKPFDNQKVSGWKDNILIFDNEPFSEVCISLERYFGVKFEIADLSVSSLPIKANFNNESFWTVVKVIKKATGLTYKTSMENNELKKIIFYEK